MTNHSLVTADRSTHFKIAAIAVAAAIVVVAVGLRARMTEGGSVTTRTETSSTVVKAGKAVTSASSEGSSIR
jgi:hypothetical protein